MVAIPGFITSFLGFFSYIFGILRRRKQLSASEQYLGDVGAIMDDDYYKRDVVIAGKKINLSQGFHERMSATRDIGHIAWLGGPAVAKMASSHLMEFSRILQDEDTPVELKKQTLYAIIEICVCMYENQNKARLNGLLDTLYGLLDSRVNILRRGATGCLVALINENYENHRTVADMPNMKEKLLKILQDDWRAWRRNESARLILMLGLNRVDDQGELYGSTSGKK
ncbi:armadillo-like helical domain-containing protein 2 [Dendronephthya gigantea]|uniref:armadillo-like helical domain-containing protein 2 n=1 Tax=Dendronephthya gigantea TaxID=151771 RepID=UPI00106A673A|nr:armadillo-like helical domain-containing protein 2 [Dendronephthya gigantea]